LDYIAAAILAVVFGAIGCQPAKEFYFLRDGDLSYYRNVATSIEVPQEPVDTPNDLEEALPPRTLWNHEKTDYWNLSLEEAIRIAMARNQVMHDLGGRVVTNPTRVATIYEPAIQETDPRFGLGGAMSQFDARFAASMAWERNDRQINNIFLGGGTRGFQQDVGRFRSELSKRTGDGTRFAVRHNVDYDWNNAPANQFPSAYDVTLEAEARHPFLQNGGVQFNRIAGPDARPGLHFRNGILLARVDTDIRLADFEAGVRDLVNDVENAYWDLYFAYRDLDAKIAARDSALATWRRVQRLRAAGAVGGEAANEARASEQYFFFRAEVENSLSGMAAGSSRAGLGTRSGAFLGAGGLYAREANLRYLLGLPGNDGRLIRPSDEPTTARVVVDWNEALAEAVTRRVELRQQRWRVKRREMELIASRNFLLPQLDAVALYRWRGFGDDLIDPDSRGAPPFDNAYQSLTDGDLQEWQLGLNFSVPLGFREGHAAVRNAQLKLARERAVLEDQKRKVSHDLAATLRELHRAYTVTQTNYNRRLRAAARVEAVRRELEDAQRTTIDRLLDAQKDQADAEVAYFQSLVEYNVAIKAVHFEKGSLLEFNDVYLTEGPWPAKAYQDAQRLARRAAKLPLDYRMTIPLPISRGIYPQQQPLETPPATKAGRPEEVPALPVGGAAATPVIEWSGAVPVAIDDGSVKATAGAVPEGPVIKQAPRALSAPEIAHQRPLPLGKPGKPASHAAPSSRPPFGFRSSVIRAMTQDVKPSAAAPRRFVPHRSGVRPTAFFAGPSPRTAAPRSTDSAAGQLRRLPAIDLPKRQ